MKRWGRNRWLTLAVALGAAAVLVAGASASFVHAPGSPIPVGVHPFTVVTADFDNDGNPDLATANATSNDVTVLLGAGDGTFTEASGSPVMDIEVAAGIAAGDFDGDGNQDLAVTEFAAADVVILLGAGDGTFAEAPGSPYTTGAGPNAIAAGLVDANAGLDLVVVDRDSDDVTVLLGNGDGTFTEAAGSPVAAGFQPWALTLADLDANGDNDIAVGDFGSGDVTVLLGDGDGTFTAAVGSPFAVGGQPVSVAADYLDGDAALDLAVAGNTSNEVAVLLGDGSGAFSAGTPVTGIDAARAVATADLDADGTTDLAVASYSGNELRIFEGDGLGGFTESADSPVPTGATPDSIAVGDWDSDGDPDLAAANENGNDLAILLNESSDSTLADLETTAGPLTPPFDPGTTAYTAGPVAFSTLVTVTPTAGHPNATIEVKVNNGAFTTVDSGTESAPLALKTGANTITVRVTAEDGASTTSYTISVTRLKASSNAQLAALSTSAGALTPAFKPSRSGYSAGTTTDASATVDATAQDPHATIQFRVNNGSYSAPAPSPATSAALPLATGANKLQVKVTAENGKNAKTYSITVTRSGGGGGGGGGGGSFADLTCSTAHTNATVTGSVTVPPGATCTLSGGVVQGAVFVQAGATLVAQGQLRVNGTILATGAARVTLDRVKVLGAIQLMNLTGADASWICRTSASDIIAIGNQAEIGIGDEPCSAGNGNTLLGSIQVLNNQELVRVSRNTIQGPLLCVGNTPAPAGIAGSNTAAVKIGQCAAL